MAKMTLYTPDPDSPKPDTPLKLSTSIAILAEHIGIEPAMDVQLGKALVENLWTGRIYEDDTVFYLETDKV